MSGCSPEQVIQYCRDVLSQVLAADGGKLYLVRSSRESIALHLAGRCGGCPARTVASDQLIKPAIEAICPGMEVEITFGVAIPENAMLLQVDMAPDSEPPYEGGPTREAGSSQE